VIDRDPERGPIFVVGVARSGTTLLRYMLCGNPRLYLAPESNFIPRFFRKHPTEPISRDRATRILSRISGYHTFWRDWQGDPPDPDELIEGLEPLTPGALVDSLYSRYAAQYGASRWGDKSTIYPAWIELFVRMFPTCQIVHVIRDVRDVTVSSLDAYRGARFFYMDAYYASRMWKERLGTAIEAGRRLPPTQYHEIRYEELTADPEAKLLELCAFLGEEFHPAMLSPSKEALKHYHAFGIHRMVRTEVTTARSGRWKRDLSPEDQRIVQRVAGTTLEGLGYRIEDLGRMGPSERLRAFGLHVKFTLSNGIRRILRAVGVFNPARLLLRLPRRRPADPGLPTDRAGARAGPVSFDGGTPAEKAPASASDGESR
jgi:sulfotransferase family protein